MSYVISIIMLALHNCYPWHILYFVVLNYADVFEYHADCSQYQCQCQDPTSLTLKCT